MADSPTYVKVRVKEAFHVAGMTFLPSTDFTYNITEDLLDSTIPAGVDNFPVGTAVASLVDKVG